MVGPFPGNSAPAPEGPAQSAHVGERRQVTVLFYDIVESTALLHQLDPEDFGHAQRIIHSEAVAAIRRHGGYLDRILGDGGCAFFGYPQPAEDAAECAVAAALELLERCEPAAARLKIGQPIRVRAGIATGLVVLSSAEGTSLPTTDEIIGLAPALASRIQTEAAPGTIAVADSTYRLTRTAFTFESLGQRAIKGFGEPQQLWRPIARRPAEDRFSRLRHPEVPLFSREDELDLCRRRWARARDGAGQIVFIVGEPGIGKSKLVTALRHEVADAGHDVRLLQCEPRGETRPFHPLEDLLQREIGGSGDGTGASNAELVRAYFNRFVPGDRGETEALTSFLLEDGSKRGADHADLGAPPSYEFMQRLIDAALGLVRAWCRERPQLVILEDLHWADTLTMALVARLVEEAEHLPLLVVATTRDRVSADLEGEANVLSLSLPRLDAAAVSHLVEVVWAPLPLPPDLPAFVHDRSDGVPLLVEELTRFLKDRFGSTASGAADWERVLRQEGVTTLRDLVSARLAGLGTARRVAQVASVIGRDFSPDLLARIMNGKTPPAPLEEQLGQLVDAGLLHRRGAQRGPAFRFRHVLIQDAAYQSLLKSERREFHDRIVRAVLEGAVASLSDDVLAWHCEQAGRLLDAAQFAVKAAESCSVRSALHEAERLLSVGEGYLGQCEPDAHTDELMLQLLMIRGPVVTALFGAGSEEARSVYERGVAISRNLSEPDPGKWFPLYWGWWFTTPDYGTQHLRSEALVSFAEKAADPEVRLQSIHCAWATDFNTGRHHDCLARTAEGLTLYDRDRANTSRIRYGGHDARVCALAERGLSLWFIGDVQAARTSVAAAIAWAEEISHPASICHALDFSLMLQRYEGNPEAAAALARRMGEIADTAALLGAQAKSKIFGGWARALRGSPAEGLRELEEGLAKQREIGTEEDFPVYIEMQAEILGLLGETEAGIAHLDHAIERAEQAGHLFWLPELYRRRALLRHAAGHEESRWRADLARAIAEAEAKGATTLADRARADLTRFSA